MTTLPWWLGAALRPAARHFGLDIGQYQRIGYARFALDRAVYERRNVRVSVRHVATDTPLLWLWRHVAGDGPRTELDGWSVVVTETKGPRRTGGTFGLVALHGFLNRLAPALERWLGHAVLREGRVAWPTGGLRLARATWDDRTFRFEGLGWKGGTADGRIAFDRNGTIVVAAGQGDFRAQLRWKGADVAGEGAAWGQPLALTAHFAPRGWIPAEAHATASAWTVAAAKLRLPGQYADVRGNAQVDWRAGGFQVSVDAAAEPAAGGSLPAASLRAEAHGDRTSWTLSALHLAAPFATAELSGPVVVGFDGRLRSGPARLAFQADLSHQTWADLHGTAAGSVQLTGGVGEPVRAVFSATADGLAWRSLAVQHAAADGSLAWPRLALDHLEATLDPTSRVSGEAAYDFSSRVVSGAKVNGRVAQSWVQRWLPAGLSFTPVEFAATADGPVNDLAHAGSIRADTVHFPPLKPAELAATWRGRGAALDEATLHLAASRTTLDLAGALRRDQARLTSLRFAPGGKEVWSLGSPAVIQWLPRWHVDTLRLQGPDSRVLVDWPEGARGPLHVEADQVQSAWAQDLFALPGPAGELRMLRFDGAPAGGAMKFSLELDGRVDLEPQPATFSIAATGDADGVKLTALKIGEEGHLLAQAQGRLPLVWNTGTGPRWSIAWDAPLDLAAHADPSSPLWASLAKSFGLTVDGPAADVRLGGTLRHPRGEVRLALARLQVGSGESKVPLPAVEQLVLTAQADRDAITLGSLSAKLDGQPLQASGRLPMDEARWRELFRDRQAFDWKKATGRLDVAEAKLAPFARYAPQFLAAQGTVEAHVQFSGGDLSGELKLRDAATRPLAEIGIVQEISADLALDGRTLRIESFAGKLGGQPVSLQGSVTVPAAGRPSCALDLKARNLPLVRRAGMLVRSDLDLHARTDAAGRTAVSGTVSLTDGLLLSDLRALLPTGERGVARPPPYFSVDLPPFSSWPLAVELRAQHTLRIRTAVFNGTASARFELSGTLGDPRATGEVSIDQGQVTFPFVSFNVQLAAVRLTAADPYHPQLTVNATARRYGYDLRMDVHGPADAPVVEFSANPALESEQVLLMVMAGQAPVDTVTTTSSQRLTQIGAYFGQGLVQGVGGGSDRLEITSGQDVSETGHETYQIEYKLNDRWTLVGEYDEFDDFNAGLKWRIYPRSEKNEGD